MFVSATGRWWWAPPLLALQSVVYPMVAIQSGMVWLLSTVARPRDLLRAPAWRAQLLPLALAAGIAIAIIGGRYLEAGEFGELATRAEMQGRSEFTKTGRAFALPVTPLGEHLAERFLSDWHVAVLIVKMLVIGDGV